MVVWETWFKSTPSKLAFLIDPSDGDAIGQTGGIDGGVVWIGSDERNRRADYDVLWTKSASGAAKVFMRLLLIQPDFPCF